MRMRLAVTLLVVACIAAGPAAAQEDRHTTLRLSSWMPPLHPLTPSLRAWAESLKKATNNTLTTTLFVAEQPGRIPEHYDMAREGIADMALVNPGSQPGRFPILAAASLPLLVANGKGGTAAVDSWYRQYAAQEMKDVKFCFAFVHEPGTLHARTRIVGPAEIRGRKIHSPNPAVASLVSGLGGSTVQAPPAEARTLLERGAADAVILPWASVLLFGMADAVRHHTDVPLYVTPLAWVINKAKYDSLSPAQKRAVDDHCTPEWAQRVATPWSEFELGARLRLAQAGHEMHGLTPEQVRDWRDAVMPAEVQWADRVRRARQDPAKVLDSLKAHLAGNRAAF
jgi:TRAP-type C4-dicarboxylate transport system substrate-binding protein